MVLESSMSVANEFSSIQEKFNHRPAIKSIKAFDMKIKQKLSLL